MADKTETLATVGKKPRRAPVRRPIELAVVVRVTDGDGQPISGGQVEILMASKDISAAFRVFKQTQGSDMVTFVLGEKKEDKDVNVERQAAE
jgi:hypothetical protein